jgi:glycerate kinase
LKIVPECQIVKLPLADGGEGSVETLISILGGFIFEVEVSGPDDKLLSAYFGITNDNKAILEVAQSSGLTKQSSLHPMTSSSYGFGQLIKAALDENISDFVLGLGGSATTDGGCGMVAALGAKFFNKQNESFIPCGATLSKIDHLDLSNLDPRIASSSFTVMSDVENPLYGPKGAAYVYAPQKGASPKQVKQLNAGLEHLSELLFQYFKTDYSKIPGSGAAGGLGAGCLCFLKGKLTSGITTVLDLYNFKQHLPGTDLLIFGEGKVDNQSFYGKALSGILQRIETVPLYIICGINKCDAATLNKHKISIFETSEKVGSELSLKYPAKYLRIATKKAINYYLYNDKGKTYDKTN